MKNLDLLVQELVTYPNETPWLELSMCRVNIYQIALCETDLA